MAQAVIMPKLGQTVEEASIVRWHKTEGDTVKKGDVLFEIETDKAVLEVESFYDGTLLKILVRAEETVPVSSTVGFVGEKGEEVPQEAAKPAPAPAREKAAPQRSAPAPVPEAARPAIQAQPAAAPVSVPAPAPAAPDQPARVFISPRARALAREKAIKPDGIAGSGPNGRIVVKDVEKYLGDRGYDSIRISAAAKKIAIREGIDILSVRGSGVSGRIMVSDVERAVAEKPRKMSKMRQVIAQRLTESFTSTPHFYVSVSVDMTDLMAYRQVLKEQGGRYTVTDFIMEAVVLSLQEFPTLNSVTDGKAVRWYGSVDLGMAVALDEGLVVPVIRNADELSMMELHDTARALAGRAREGKLLPDEMSGSTFTVSNMGMLNVESFSAIINPGEAAILAIGSTADEAAVRGGKVVVRSIMKMTLSADHRIVDGRMGAEFINAIKDKLEDIELWKSMT